MEARIRLLKQRVHQRLPCWDVRFDDNAASDESALRVTSMQVIEGGMGFEPCEPMCQLVYSEGHDRKEVIGQVAANEIV